MKKEEIIINFSRNLFKEKDRKNAVTISNINTTLIEAALNSAFVNESCKSTEEISKSQIIYRKLEGRFDSIQFAFRKNAEKFLRLLKIFSRNRKFILSYDTTEEPFYGFPKNAKKEERYYLHSSKEAKGAKYCYKYLTVAITCNNGIRYIIDGKILRRGCYIEDYVYEMTRFVKKIIPLEVVLFDRGFGWGIIKKLKELNVRYMVFWKKQGSWYKKCFDKLKDGEFCTIKKNYKYNRYKSNFPVESDFILVKQCEYEGKKYDWIFATNLNLSPAKKYVKWYKKRWGIETIFRVTDDIRIYTTSTNPIIRYFLFMFTCFVYNVWKFFQFYIGEELTLANFSTNMNKFMIEKEMIRPKHYKEFTSIFTKYNILSKQIR